MRGVFPGYDALVGTETEAVRVRSATYTAIDLEVVADSEVGATAAAGGFLQETLLRPRAGYDDFTLDHAVVVPPAGGTWSSSATSGDGPEN